YTIFLLLHSLFTLVAPTWYWKEHKVCDPSSSNMVPSTGFKINRQYKISGLFPPFSMHFIQISHCDHGQVDYQKVKRTMSSTDIDWDKPFCMLKPKLGDVLSLPPEDTVENLLPGNNGTISGYSEIPNSRLERFGQFVRNKFDKALESLTAGKRIQYKGNIAYHHLEDIKQADPQSSFEWESRNLVCYKMARRKKYAKRDVSFYMPNTFVGGLFECPVSAQQKKTLFQQFGNEDFLKSLDFDCDSSLARPILPLIAQDSTQQWIDTNFKDFLNPSIVQTIPYLATASPWNLRFSLSNTADMNSDTWATKIDVNEQYVYSESEVHVISRAVAVSADYLNRIISPIDINKFSQRYNNWLSKSQQWENPILEEGDMTKIMSSLSFDQRLQLIISSKTRKVAMEQIQKLQDLWDQLQ
ncbi:predicted protein, partial [Scheffersomyces stipitis CBS 6054]